MSLPYSLAYAFFCSKYFGFHSILLTAKPHAPTKNIKRKMIGQLSEDDFNDWRICWRINAAFSAAFVNDQATTCIKCSAQIAPDTLPYRSSFVSSAVGSSCAHIRSGSLCSDCDMDMVFKVTRGEEKCFSQGCDAILNVESSVVSAALSNVPKLLAEYATLV